MEVDFHTRTDLQLLQENEGISIIEKIDYTQTSNGKKQLYHLFQNPLNNLDSILEVQQTLQWIMKHHEKWPTTITNGTILMIEKFYESNLSNIPEGATNFSAALYKWLNASHFSVISFSMTHFFDFVKGWEKLIHLLLSDQTPGPLKKILEDANQIINKNELSIIHQLSESHKLTEKNKLQLGYFFTFRFKHSMQQLLNYHEVLDAWQSMASAVIKCNLVFPEFINSDKPNIKAEGLFHLLLNTPVAYDVMLKENNHFIFLTGANMAGKSTFIKSLGTAVYLSHLGMGVPASKMELSLFDGILSNINIADNIHQGESFFFNEVQRIKTTIEKINNKNKWLILIDELFKGTNIEDAMKCSTLVIEGLVKIPNSVFVLSTHLYEIGDSLKKYTTIQFKYFETEIKNDQFTFSYQLKEGISNDRLGYLILKKEGVLKMLNDL